MKKGPAAKARGATSSTKTATAKARKGPVAARASAPKTTARTAAASPSRSAARPKTTARSAQAQTKPATAAKSYGTGKKTVSRSAQATAGGKGIRRAAAASSRAAGPRTPEIIIQDLRGCFEASHSGKKGQALGAAMRMPNKLFTELETSIGGIVRSATRVEARASKLSEEVQGLKQQAAAGGWPQARHETAAQDGGQQQAGVSGGAPVAGNPDMGGTGNFGETAAMPQTQGAGAD